MNVFIGIESCNDHRYAQAAIRETWVKDCPTDWKFFIGKNSLQPCSDEIMLPVSDGQHKLFHKFSLEVNWVLEHGYDFFFRCHVDTYVDVPRLLASGFEAHDYAGYPQDGWPDCAPLCYGGSGFWLSRKAMLFFQQEVKQREWQLKFNEIEDYHIGAVLERGGFERFGDYRYKDRRPGPRPDNDCITLHDAVTDGVDGKNLRDRRYMLETHREAQGL